MKEMTNLIFSYGTLQLKSVQIGNYGHTLKGVPDKLVGYKLMNLPITDTIVLAKSQVIYHPIAVKSDTESDIIEGLIFEITNAELAETDKYEVAQYRRIIETFASGKKAWIYIGSNLI